jgi:serine protease
LPRDPKEASLTSPVRISIPRAPLVALVAGVLLASTAGPFVRGDEGLRDVEPRFELMAERAAVAESAPRPVIVGFHPNVDDRIAELCVKEAGGGFARRSAFSRRYVVDPAAGFAAQDLVTRFTAMPEVAYAEEDGIVRAHFTPNDNLYRFQWHWRQLGMERTWDIQRGDPTVAVAVLDTGIAYEDFGRFRKAPDWGSVTFLPGYNVFTRDSHANDDNFHGTHVASIIAEATNNGEGVAGMAHLAALMPVKVLNAAGFGSNAGIAEGIDYVVRFRQNGVNPVKVINLSLGGSTRSTAMQNAVNAAVAAGIVVVASSGNDNLGMVDFPAAEDAAIAVGATDTRKLRTYYSNFGSALDLVAPGGDLRVDADGDGRRDGILQQTFDPNTAERLGRYDDFAYFFVSGTSQAAPQVAALAALLARQGIGSPAAIRAIMERTAEDLGAVGRDDSFGHGLIRPAEALKGLGLNR